MSSDGFSARFDDLDAGCAWVFGRPDRVLTARSLGEVIELLAEVDRSTRAGAWAWGYVSYEAAPAFDSALRVRPPEPDGLPLACFAIGSAPRVEPRACPASTSTRPTSGTWHLDWTADEYHRRLAQVRDAIAAGDAYQVNLTTRMRRHNPGDPLELYRALIHAQRGTYNAYLDLGDDLDGRVILSASPELFFQWDAGGLTARPMKGTARRGATNAEDTWARAALVASAKERAENVMIVDLLRNDLSRVAQVGSVQVRSLLDAERLETVWQLTSTVVATPEVDTTLPGVFAALFPCGSVTGAPKAAAMGLIAHLETSPRGVYCGAIGMVAPPDSGFRARFGVAIRTVVVDRVTGMAVYGTGGGITWDSDPGAEYDELLAKAAILDHPVGDFDLLETLRFEPKTGLRNLDRHLRRLLDSARYFGFSADPAHIDVRIRAAAASLPLDGPRRVRLLLARDGHIRVEDTPLPRPSREVVLALDTCATVTGRWTRHKTTRRDHYEAAAARHPRADDVILLDPSDRVIETTRANLAADIDGRWYTPPLSSGCLPGVERQRLLDAGRLHERTITRSDLSRCRHLAVVSSLWGWRVARLWPHPTDG